MYLHHIKRNTKNPRFEWRCRNTLYKPYYYDDEIPEPEDPDAWPIEPKLEPEDEDDIQPLLEDDLFDLIESNFTNMEDNK